MSASCLPPFDTTIEPLPGAGIVEHGLVEVGHHVVRVGLKFWCKRPRDRAAAGRRFKHRAGGEGSDKLRHVGGIGLEDQGDHQRVVELRDRAREHLVALSHEIPLKALNGAPDHPFQNGPGLSNKSAAELGIGDDALWWPRLPASSTSSCSPLHHSRCRASNLSRRIADMGRVLPIDGGQ